MFKVYITESSYKGIISKEEQRTTSGRSNLYKLLKQQPVQLLTAAENDKFKTHPEEVQKGVLPASGR